jgi:hypothetical protein
MKLSFSQIIREYKWFFVLSFIVNFFTSIAYDKVCPNNSQFSLQRIAITFFPGLIIAEIYRRKIKRKFNDK